MKVVRIDLENTYDLLSVTPDLMEATFNSYDKNKNLVLVKIQIKPIKYPMLPDVYNLSFGTPNPDGTINDTMKLFHLEPDRMFSTLLSFALGFLKRNPHLNIGFDGSNDIRAYLYHRILLANKRYLSDYFTALGVDWFVRLLRNGEIERSEDGRLLFKPKPEKFDYQRSTLNLYRYYMFHLSRNKK